MVKNDLSEDAEKNQLEMAKMASQVAVEKLSLAYPSGVVFWNARKKTPQIAMGGNGVVILWPMFSL